ncbi:hypothetical protein K440DRAFT_642532 [Wilcoxina mikolae CBS 423.85]|nr:hypothetical protein K440DRAFT_642532 [Wilcoxina mikolae CBS 423.85]
MSIIPSSHVIIPDNHTSTAVPPGEWAQIIIGACGLVVTIAGLAIKYRKGLKNWIFGCWNSLFQQSATAVETGEVMELESQGSVESIISEGECEEFATVELGSEEVGLDDNGVQDQDKTDLGL